MDGRLNCKIPKFSADPGPAACDGEPVACDGGFDSEGNSEPGLYISVTLWLNLKFEFARHYTSEEIGCIFDDN